uniref:Uncharacterized protein n=1 Tax=Tanacetum cinerariifolium TaxID=118510 RepID=A0A6L2J403_TANCI|nr:hypothetical protein [Tanacetum cinerariifolium]
MARHKEMYVISSHTKKIFANIRRIGAEFYGVITPLFDIMMVQATADMGDTPVETHQSPIDDQPSTFRPQKKQKPKRKQRKEAEVSPDELEDEDHVPTPFSDPLPSGEDSYTLNELMVFCTSLQEEGRMIKEIDQDDEIALDANTQGRKTNDEMFGVNDLTREEVVITVTDKVSTTLTIDVTEDEITMAQALATLKSASSKRKKEVSKVQKARLLVELIEKRKKHFVALRAQEKRNKTPPKAQMKGQICTYLRNMGGYKHSYLKGRSYYEIKKLFDREMKKVNHFIAMDSEAQKSCGKESQESVIDDTEELKKYMEIVPDDEDEVLIEATPISSRSPTIIDYKIYKEEKENYFMIIRDDAKDKFKKEKPVEDMDNLLFRTLKTMFEHHVEGTIWTHQQGLAKVKNWKLFESCEVYCITMQSIIYYLLVEKVYPLTRNTLHKLWSDVRLQVDHDVEMAYDLLRFIRKQLMEGYTP